MSKNNKPQIYECVVNIPHWEAPQRLYTYASSDAEAWKNFEDYVNGEIKKSLVFTEPPTRRIE